ncbi:MAG: sigma-70 family RNA polymerase sigma factor [Patescibacteria group bacterium]|nr:sigma-70 family RNA polymerase sigma factor [Patescibacteria group bacterium]
MNDYSLLSDEKIVGLAQGGDFDGFGFLAEKYQEKIKRYIRRFVQSEEINDISQNVFLKAFENIRGFNVKLKFSSWIYRIAHNEIVNFLKKKKALPLFDFDVFLPHLDFGRDEMENAAERKILRTHLEQCFEKLPMKYREVVWLYYFDEFSYREISDVLKLPPATIGTRLKRARQALKTVCAGLNKVYG